MRLFLIGVGFQLGKSGEGLMASRAVYNAGQHGCVHRLFIYILVIT
jgi:hypothetical protein